MYFVPDDLPPTIKYTEDVVERLSEAERALSNLDAAGKNLSNPKLIVEPYSRIEAVMSSRIEGTRADLDDLYLHEARDEEQRIPDVVEVENYVQAMDLGLKKLEKLPISTRLIKDVHRALMSGVKGDYAQPGRLRESQNWVGGPWTTIETAQYVPPPPDMVPALLDEWAKYINSSPRETVLVQAAISLYQFEAIHPFIDGNGRVGRLLITLLLCERGVMTEPLLYISSYIIRHRDAYYNGLLSITERGEWEEWLLFFLAAVAVQAKEATQLAVSLIDLHDEYLQRIDIPRVPKAANMLVDQVFINPYISIGKLCEEWGMAYPTVKRGVGLLVEKGVLEETTGQKRHRLFAASELLSLLGRY